MTVVEFATWPVAENWRELMEPGLKIARESAGCTDLFVGIAEEDPHTAQLAVVWDSIEHHQDLIKSPQYPVVVGCVSSALPPGSDLSSLLLYHVDFSTHARTTEEADIHSAFSNKITEKAVITLNEGTTKDQVVEILNSIRDFITEESKLVTGISTPVVWGQTVENPNVFVLLIGWESSKLHYDVIAQDKYKPVLGPLHASTDINMKHIPFKK